MPSEKELVELTRPECKHGPAETSWRYDFKQYHLFAAAYDGCLPCVKRLVEVDGVPLDSKSFHKGYTALDWAKWGVDHDRPGCAGVVDWVTSELNRRASTTSAPSTTFSEDFEMVGS